MDSGGDFYLKNQRECVQMICLSARCLVVCGALLLPMTRAAAVELEIGARSG